MTKLNRRTFVQAALAAPLAIAATTARAATHQVAIEGFAFVPADLSVAVGDTIVFTNNDGAPHTATADAFDTGRLGRNASAEITVSAAGDHNYICRFHPRMKGVIRAS